MYDAIGVEIKKGDLLLNFYTYRGKSGINSRLKVAVDFTNTRVVTGLVTETYGRKTRDMVVPAHSVVTNHKWKDIFKNDQEKDYIIEVLEECEIKPNIDEHRLPSKEGSIVEVPVNDEDLTNI